MIAKKHNRIFPRRNKMNACKRTPCSKLWLHCCMTHRHRKPSVLMTWKTEKEPMGSSWLELLTSSWTVIELLGAQWAWGGGGGQVFATLSQREAEEMLEGQNPRVDIFAHVRTAHNSLLQKRLEQNFCQIAPHVPPTTPAVSRDWTKPKLNKQDVY